MPFMRKGLCAVDQVKCANMLAEGESPAKVAKKLRTTVEYAKKFTREALDEHEAYRKKATARAEKSLKDTKKAANALADAASQILSRPQSDGEDDFT